MGNLRVEYLILLKENGSFCNTIKSFNNLLESNSNIKILQKKINFINDQFGYEIKTNSVKDKAQRYFKLTLTAEDETTIPNLQMLLKSIRELIHKAEGNINVTWDDISNFYSIKAYPEINKIENLLRKLITTFMLTNFGIEWTKETTPQEVKSNIRKKNKNSDSNYLHDTDFIQLADFLFKPYPTKDINQLFKELKIIKKIEEIDLENLKEYIPKSNWERYFKSFVDCDDDYLNKNWQKLYDLRCIIAHNNFLSKLEYDIILEIVKNLSEKFEQAINSLDEISVPKDEQKLVLENAVKAKNENLEKFFKIWNDVYIEIKNLYHKKGFKTEENQEIPMRQMVETLISSNILTQEFKNELYPIGEFRSKLDSVLEEFTDKDVLNKTNEIKDFYDKRIFLEDPFFENVAIVNH